MRTIKRFALVALAAACVAAIVPTSTSAAITQPGHFETNLAKGTAYGAEATLTHEGEPPLLIQPDVEVGRVATQNIPCTATSGKTYQNEVASLTAKLPSGTTVLSTGKVVNTTMPTFDPDFVQSKVESKIDNVNLLGGTITATALDAISITRYDSTGVNKNTTVDDYTADDEGSGAVFASLVINGEAIESAPAPNTVIPLGSVGHVILNEQRTIPHPKIAVGPAGSRVRYTPGLIVNAIHVVVNNLSGWSGDIVVGHAESRIREATARVSGYAFASQARIDPPLMSGRQSVIYLPCPGTNGNTLQLDGVGGTIVPGTAGTDFSVIASTSTTHGTVEADIPATISATEPAYSESTETIEDVKLLVDGDTSDPMFSADLIKTVARTEGVTTVKSTSTVEVVNLVLPGQEPFTGPVEPNTKVDIPGIGFIRFHERSCGGRDPVGSDPCEQSEYGGITAYAVHLKVTAPDNALGLPVGAEIWIGAAHSDVRI